MLVFVYGSLKKGFINHELLAGSSFLGEHITEPRFTMYDLGAFPAVCQNGDTAIHGEVYDVDEATFRRLDRLEGYPSFYDRMLIPTEYGEAYVYFLHRPYSNRVVESGKWLE